MQTTEQLLGSGTYPTKPRAANPQSMAITPIHLSPPNIPFHTRLKPLSPPLPSRYYSFVVNCININGSSNTKSSKLIKNGGQLVDQQEDELLKATQRVELAKKELAEAQKQEIEARKTMESINQLKTRASETVDAEDGRRAMYKKKEKLESIKAALISAIVGTLASLPISLTHVTNTYDLTVSTAITISSCALYGATFRYVIRRDLEDFHLKNGTSAAFGIVKGLATLDGGTYLGQDVLNGAICVSENVLIFVFAAAGLDICYKMGMLSPYPIERPVSRTKM